VALSGCAIAVDSSNSDALTVNGGSTVTASAITVAGGDSITNGGSTTPAPTTGATSVADPLASLPSPAVGACNYTNYKPRLGNLGAHARSLLRAESTSPTAPRLHRRGYLHH